MTAALLGVVAALAWGAHDFLARYASRGIGYLNTVLAVTVIGAVFLWLWMGISQTAFDFHPSALWLIGLTGLVIALATMCLYAALAIGPIAIVCPIVAAYPAFAVAFAVIMGARPGWLEWLAMFMVMGGVAVVARCGSDKNTDGQNQSWPRRRTLILSFLSSIGFAVSIIAGQSAARIYGEIPTASLARLAGIVVVGLFYLRARDKTPLPAKWWPMLVIMGVLDVVALASVLGAGQLPKAETATVISSTFGAVTVLLGWRILKETITWRQWLGMGLIFASVAYLSLHGS